MPRDGSNKDIKWIDINPCFVFHPMNAYEEDNKIILHVCRQNKAMVGGMDEIYGGKDTTGKLWKWTINLDAETCKEEQIDVVKLVHLQIRYHPNHDQFLYFFPN